MSEPKMRPHVLVKPPQHLDAVTSGPLEKDILASTSAPGTVVILGMADVAFVSSAGIRFLLVTKDRVRNLGGELWLAKMNSNVLEVLTICALDRVLTIRESVEQSLVDLSQSQ
ncbi:MAG: STAS domain-containing protein [Planctomycetes bacterium]|nr:STAS domain-containing protein [Planctomycetota bacterium]